MRIFYFMRFKFRNLLYRLGKRPIRSSFPFISGDTYRLHCKIDLSLDDSFTGLSNLPQSIFITSGQISRLSTKVADESFDLSKSDLFIHNGDETVNHKYIIELARHFKTVYAVNWLGSHTKIKPIPIGLENVRFLRNGLPADFHVLADKTHPSFQERSIELLVAFSVHTNPGIRSAAFQIAREIVGAQIIETPIKPYEYLGLVRNSKFVLSPPGNGPDCHRTWEAIYLGAIPIVHASAWPFRDFDLPVIVLEDWEDLSYAMAQYRNPGPISKERLLEFFFPLGEDER
jgi:hypothetical protein